MSWALDSEGGVCWVIDFIGYLLRFFLLHAAMRACPLVSVFHRCGIFFRSGGFSLFGKSHGNRRGKGGEFGVAPYGHRNCLLASIRDIKDIHSTWPYRRPQRCTCLPAVAATVALQMRPSF